MIRFDELSAMEQGMQHRILRINIALFVMLFGLMAGIDDVQANDGIEVAGDILVVALPSAAVGLTIGLKDGQGTLLSQQPLPWARLLPLNSPSIRSALMVRTNHSRLGTLRCPSPPLSSYSSVTDGSMACQLTLLQHLFLTAALRQISIIRST